MTSAEMKKEQKDGNAKITLNFLVNTLDLFLMLLMN
jgi:hypothetical protein